MDCIFRSFSIVVLQILFILSVTSVSLRKDKAVKRQGPNDDKSAVFLYGPNEKGSVEKLRGPNDDNSAELLNGPNEEGSVEKLQGPNEDNSAALLNGPNEDGSVEKLQGLNEDYSAALLSGPNKDGSVEKLQGPNGKSGEALNGPNEATSKEILQATDLLAGDQQDAETNKNKFVELDIHDNETIAKLLEEEVAHDESASNEKPPKDDKAVPIKGHNKMISHSYLEVDKSHADIDTSDSGFSDSNPENDQQRSIDQKREKNRYEEELKRGNLAESYGTNPHYYQPDKYPDLGRRYSQQYPYKEDEGINLVNKDLKQTNLEPKLASPDLVLAVARESAVLDAARSKNPSEYLIEKDALRSGNYWNAVWKEDIKPEVLRSNSKKPLGAIPAKINPGSNLYNLVTKLKQISPRLLYVINKKIEY